MRELSGQLEEERSRAVGEVADARRKGEEERQAALKAHEANVSRSTIAMSCQKKTIILSTLY